MTQNLIPVGIDVSKATLEFPGFSLFCEGRFGG